MELLSLSDYCNNYGVQIRDVVLSVEIGFFNLSIPCDLDSVFRSGFILNFRDLNNFDIQEFCEFLRNTKKFFIQCEIIGHKPLTFCDIFFLKKEGEFNKHWCFEVYEKYEFDKFFLNHNW